MLTIPCPHCGERAETEFVYGGDADVARPSDPAALTDAEWAAFLYLRDNPRGRHSEYWYHRSGCRRWLRVERDTVTHRVFAAAFAATPERGSE